MKLHTDSWHFKIYKRWLEIKNRNYGKRDLDGMLWRIKDTKTHNLCLYMRVVMFWGPIKMFFFSPKAWLSTGIVLFLGLIYLELSSANMGLFIVLSDVLIMFIICLVGWVILAALVIGGIEYLKEKYQNRPEKEKRPSIVWEYIKAKKQKVCPVLSFDEEE